MLTPQNFREKTFERAVFGGYDMAAVDEFLDQAANDYAAVAKENMVLKSKMKVLVDKIEEYRQTEETMRMTLMSAQKLSLQIEQETREKSTKALSDSRDEAERLVREAYTQRATEEAKLLEAKREATQYIENMRQLCTGQLNFLDSLERMKLEDIKARRDASPVANTGVDDTVRSIESSVERMVDTVDDDTEIREYVSNAAELSSDRSPAFSPSPSQGAQFNMDNLRFGRGEQADS